MDVQKVLSLTPTAAKRKFGDLRNNSYTASAVYEHPAGSVLTGAETWASGPFLVLSGDAAVVCSVNGEEARIATLKRGSSFGWAFEDLWESLSARQPAGDFSWDSLGARILVGTAEPLRVCHMDTEHAEKWGVGSWQRFTCNSDLDGMTRQLADLWLSASPPPVGIALQPAGLLRAHFQAALWGPLLSHLEEHDDEIRRRKRRGYRSNDQFPLQGHQISELRDYILHVTEVWYGSDRGGNLSSFYRWFMKAMDLVGVTAYTMDVIPTEGTADGWCNIVDGNARVKALKARGAVNSSHVATGGMTQKQGQSAIDNTVLVNVFTGQEARLLLVGRRLRKVMCKLIAIRQTCILRRLSQHLRMHLLNQASEESTGRDHRVMRSVLRLLSTKDLAAAGIDRESFCFRALEARGCVISGFGQLEPGAQKTVWELVTNILLPEGAPKDVTPKEDSDDVFDRLVLWSRKFPGDFFEKDKLRHFEVMIGGIWCGKVVLVKHSAMERMTLARYFAVPWKRTQPLWAVLTGDPVPLREAGIAESSRVRANECPYAAFHGMSLPAGGFARDERRRGKGLKENGYSLMMELQWVQDPAANLENWFLTDVEKILQEAWFLNPHIEKALMLPGEMFINVGQNPKIGSSIKNTQHTQLCEGSLSSYPLMQVRSPEGPRPSAALGGASVDFVDIGPGGAPKDECGFFVKVHTERPAAPAVVQFLVELRLRLLAAFGGAEALDFLVTAMGDDRGGFVVLFAPIPQLEKICSDPDVFANPSTGESSESALLEEPRLDFGKGVGQFLCQHDALREQLRAGGEDTLRRIWAFNRVPGIREFVWKFVAERKIIG